MTLASRKFKNEKGEEVLTTVETMPASDYFPTMVHAQVFSPGTSTDVILTDTEMLGLLDTIIEARWGDHRDLDAKVPIARLHDSLRVDALFARVQETTNLPRQATVQITRAVIEAMDHLGIALSHKPIED